MGLIHDIPTCADLVSRIEREAIETLQKTQNLLVDEVPSEKIQGKSGGQIQGSSDSMRSNKPNPGAQLWGIEKSKL